jgi:hypothetical protein
MRLWSFLIHFDPGPTVAFQRLLPEGTLEELTGEIGSNIWPWRKWIFDPKVHSRVVLPRTLKPEFTRLEIERNFLVNSVKKEFLVSFFEGGFKSTTLEAVDL